MKQCKSYKEFIKIVRKYSKRVWLKDRCRGWVYPWIEYDIYTEDQVQECLRHTTYCKGNLLLILKDFLRDKGKMVVWTHNHYGNLLGVEVTNEDYYWIYKSLDGKMHLASCVGKYELIDERSVKEVMKK